MKYFDTKRRKWIEEECVEEDGFVVNKKGVLIQYYGSDKNVTIPRKLNGILVTSIGDGILNFSGIYAFHGCTDLVSIKIPDSVTSIGNSAFAGCSNLTEITIPNSITFIGKKAFQGCINLRNIIIPASVTFIGESAFSGCFKLKEVTVDKENVTFINIDGVLFDKQQHSLLFYPAEKPNTSYIIPDGVKIIGNSAFYNCYNLKNITLPDTITKIEESAFENCSHLTKITIPASVTTIGERAFTSCYDLKDISLSEGITTIGRMAFSCCDNLTRITIPNGVTYIGTYAFSDCRNLRSITIPASVKSIEIYTFWGCDNLESISIYNNNIDIDEMNILGDREKTRIYAHEGSTTERYAKRKGYKFIPLI